MDYCGLVIKLKCLLGAISYFFMYHAEIVYFINTIISYAILLTVPQHFKMSLNIFKCPSTFSNVPQHIKMSLNIFKCSSTFSNVPQHFQMSLNIFKCPSTFSNVPQHFQMSLNIFKCPSTSSNVPQNVDEWDKITPIIQA